MLLLLLRFAIFLQVRGLTAKTAVIVGGRDAEPGEFPYIVSIQTNGEHICGGSIITDEWILSAAHCFQENIEAFHYTVVTGTVDLDSGGNRHWVNEIINHNFSFVTGDNDIALLLLRNKISFNSSTYSTILPTEDTPVGTKVDLSGWGFTSYNPPTDTTTLKALTLRTVTNQECQDAYNSINVTVQIIDKKICTFTKLGEGVCPGDSGGPLVDPNLKVQVGIVSASMFCAKGIPDIFTRVYKYIDWINEKMSLC